MAELRVVVPDELDRYLDSVIKSGMFGNKAEFARAAIVQFMNTIGPISKGYDNDTFFSPDGRIFQIEYARESANRGGMVLGFACTDGILLAAEDPQSKFENTLMMSPMKIHRLSDNIIIGLSGMVMDGSVVIDRLKAEQYKNPDTLLSAIREIYWQHTIKKDVRPLGVSMLVGTNFSHPRLFRIDPSGTVNEFSAVAVGDGNEEAVKRLARAYKHQTMRQMAKLIPGVMGKEKEFIVEMLGK